MSGWFKNFDDFTQSAKEAVSKASARLEVCLSPPSLCCSHARSSWGVYPHLYIHSFANIVVICEWQEITDGVRAEIAHGAETVENSLFQEEVELRKEKEIARAEEIQGLPWETSLAGDDQKALTETLMGRIMDLSLDEENFTTKPPHEAHFEDSFKLRSHTGIAERMMAIDPNLARKHSKLIPNFPEHDFWMCYFYKVEMLRQEVGFEPLATMVLATTTTDTLKEDETHDVYDSSIEFCMINKQDALSEPEQDVPNSPNDDEVILELDSLEGLNDDLEDDLGSKQEGDDELEAQIAAELSSL